MISSISTMSCSALMESMIVQRYVEQPLRFLSARSRIGPIGIAHRSISLSGCCIHRSSKLSMTKAMRSVNQYPSASPSVIRNLPLRVCNHMLVGHNGRHVHTFAFSKAVEEPVLSALSGHLQTRTRFEPCYTQLVPTAIASAPCVLLELTILRLSGDAPEPRSACSTAASTQCDRLDRLTWGVRTFSWTRSCYQDGRGQRRKRSHRL